MLADRPHVLGASWEEDVIATGPAAWAVMRGRASRPIRLVCAANGMVGEFGSSRGAPAEFVQTDAPTGRDDRPSARAGAQAC